MLMAHQSPAYVQWQLGQSSIQITVDRYCHWIPGEGSVRKPDRKSHIIKNGLSKLLKPLNKMKGGAEGRICKIVNNINKLLKTK